ncbi:MAG: hypothetical protein JXR61_06245 [Prolixibacteraceae bacterium]|nr:hypothetical protein [Prolixibacteraceae bacterium]
MKVLIFIILSIVSLNCSGQETYKHDIRGGGETELYLQRGDKVSINASGTVILGVFAGSGGLTGIQGFEIYSNVRDYPHGSLIAKVGENGVWHYIGNGKTITADKNGFLRIYVNDIDTKNNTGGFAVECQKIVNYNLTWKVETNRTLLRKPTISEGYAFWGSDNNHLNARL